MHHTRNILILYHELLSKHITAFCLIPTFMSNLENYPYSHIGSSLTFLLTHPYHSLILSRVPSLGSNPRILDYEMYAKAICFLVEQTTLHSFLSSLWLPQLSILLQSWQPHVNMNEQGVCSFEPSLVTGKNDSYQPYTSSEFKVTAFRFFNKNNISVQNICSSSMCVCDATWIGRYVIWALKVSLLEFSIVLKANLRMRRQAKFVGVFLFF